MSPICGRERNNCFALFHWSTGAANNSALQNTCFMRNNLWSRMQTMLLCEHTVCKHASFINKAALEAPLKHRFACFASAVFTTCDCMWSAVGGRWIAFRLKTCSLFVGQLCFRCLCYSKVQFEYDRFKTWTIVKAATPEHCAAGCVPCCCLTKDTKSCQSDNFVSPVVTISGWTTKLPRSKTVSQKYVLVLGSVLSDDITFFLRSDSMMSFFFFLLEKSAFLSRSLWTSLLPKWL